MYAENWKEMRIVVKKEAGFSTFLRGCNPARFNNGISNQSTFVLRS